MTTNTNLNTNTVSVPVIQGGSGIASTVAYAPICGGTTTTSALQSVASVGSIGQYLTSNGSALPTYQAFPSLGSSPITYTKVTLSSADITTMRVTPKLLVSAGGANTLLYMMRVILELDFNSIAYTGGGNTFIQWDSTTLGGGVIASSTIAATQINGNTKRMRYMNNAVAAALASSTTVNKGLYLTNATAAFATGNSTIYMHVYYVLLSTTI